MGSFFTLAVPKFKDVTEVNIKSASRRLSGTVKQIYHEAAFKKKIYKLSFDIKNSEYWTEVLDENEFLIISDPSFKRRKLPNGVYFREIITDRSLVNSLSDDEEFILFLPTGFVEPAEIHIEADNGSHYTIVTKPYTGGTIVYDEEISPLKK